MAGCFSRLRFAGCMICEPYNKIPGRSKLQSFSHRRNNQTGHQTNEKTCDDAGNHQHRQIEEQVQILDHEDGNENLADVVADTACNADAYGGQAFDLPAEHHHDEAQKTAGNTVEQCGHIAEGEGDKQNSYNRDDQCLSGVQQIKGNHHHKVGKTKLDTGNTKIKWDQDFNIAEDHSQSNEKR